MARAVLFDFYGILARAVSWGTPFEEVFTRRGLRVDAATWHRSGDDVVYDG